MQRQAVLNMNRDNWRCLATAGYHRNLWW